MWRRSPNDMKESSMEEWMEWLRIHWIEWYWHRWRNGMGWGEGGKRENEGNRWVGLEIQKDR